MKRFAIVLAFLGATALAAAPPVVKVPVEVKTEVGEWVFVEAETDAKAVKFVPLDAGLKQFPSKFLADPKAGAFYSSKPGTYRVLAYTGNADGPSEPVITKVVVGGIAPPPDPVDPVDPPAPAGTVARFVVVEDSLQSGSWRGDLLGDDRVSAYVLTQKIRHHVVDVKTRDRTGQTPPELAPYLTAAAGKPMPYILTLDSAGKVLSAGEMPRDAVKLLALLGEKPGERRMGNLIPPAGRAPLRAWPRFGATPDVPLIPRANWKPMSLGAYLSAVRDQDGIGACVAFATVMASQSSRNVSGMTPRKLSTGYLYGKINGGTDQGAYLEDALAEMVERGTCLNSTVGDLDWRSRPAAAVEEAKGYRVVEAYQCPNFDAMASAVQQGFFIIEGLLWYSGYNPDSNGWLPNRPTGSLQGGHALCGYGLAQRSDGTWGLRTRNSWGTGWGKGGDCIIPEGCFGTSVGGFWAVRVVTYEPSDLPRPIFAGKLEQKADVPTLKP